MSAVEACKAYGKTPPANALEPETNATSGSAENKKSSAGQGFIDKTNSSRGPAWHAGGQNNQITREVRVGGMTYRVADDARTAPIR